MTARPYRQSVDICMGGAALDVGELTFVRDGHREYSAFAYRPRWLTYEGRFQISPDLPLGSGYVTRRATTAEDSPFPHAIADSEPDAWGRQIIRRAHAKRRRHDAKLGPLTHLDYLAAVDDFSRVGALRLRNDRGTFLSSETHFRTPELLELPSIYRATCAVERGRESEADLEYLLGRATSLGGLRPKCTLIDQDGALALGKFPGIGDTRSIVRGEVLALELARLAGIDAARARIHALEDTPVAIIRRFDRAPNAARIAYLSAGSLLQARRDEDRSYTEIADALRRVSARPREDVRELWHRMLFNLLINNVDDHLWNLGVLYAGDGLWALAPAFDLNPFPDRARESKTWLSAEMGPITSLHQLLEASEYFGIGRAEAGTVAAAMAAIVATWREIATSPTVGITEAELEAFEPAFEHAEARAARIGAT